MPAMAKEIKTIAEPPLEELVRVGTNGFGFINGQTQEKWLETIFLAACVAVHFKFSKGLQVLTHIPPFFDYSHLQIIFPYLANKQLMNGQFLKKISIVYSSDNDPAKSKGHGFVPHQEEATNVLRRAGIECAIEHIRTPDHAVLFDRRGEPYWADKGRFEMYQIGGVDSSWKFPSFSPPRDGGNLFCDNTGEFASVVNDYSIPDMDPRGLRRAVTSVVNKLKA